MTDFVPSPELSHDSDVSPPLPLTILPSGAADTNQPPSDFGTPVPSLHRTLSISNETPVPRQSKRYRVPSSDKESEVEIVEPARVLSDMVLVGPVRIFTIFNLDFLTYYYFSFSLVNVVAR